MLNSFSRITYYILGFVDTPHFSVPLDRCLGPIWVSIGMWDFWRAPNWDHIFFMVLSLYANGIRFRVAFTTGVSLEELTMTQYSAIILHIHLKISRFFLIFFQDKEPLTGSRLHCKMVSSKHKKTDLKTSNLRCKFIR